MSPIDAVRSRFRPRSGAQATAAPESSRDPDRSLIAERDRLATRFTIMQCELGGLFYEMAIRDHVRMDVLLPRAAALQRVDAQLSQLEHLLAEGVSAVGGHCERCGAAHARGAGFCSQCGHPVGT